MMLFNGFSSLVPVAELFQHSRSCHWNIWERIASVQRVIGQCQEMIRTNFPQEHFGVCTPLFLNLGSSLQKGAL